MCYTYIIFSASKDKYYVGSSRHDLVDRIRRHNSKHKGFTGGEADWVIVYSKQFETYQEACAMEMKIKSWKSRQMIEKLI